MFRWDAAGQARHDYEDVFLTSKRDLAALLEIPLERAAVLVLGCGYNYPDVILFHEIVQEVVGLDVLPAFYRDGLGRALSIAWREAPTRPTRAVRALAKYCNYRRYYHHLAHAAGVKPAHDSYHLIGYDGGYMPFEDETFDIAVSNAVLEHVADLETLVAELARVTRRGGLSYHLWHNYYSYRGSHLPEALCRAAPWGHLRGIYQTSGLNSATPDQVRDAFAAAFEVVGFYAVDRQHRKKGVDAGFAYEAEDLLTLEIADELSRYPRELLLTRAYLVVARKAG